MAADAAARITGIGISRIGRRTGIPGPELTLEATRAALADAGIAPDAVEAVASMGDTPVPEVVAALGVGEATDLGGFGAGGLLEPVLQAVEAVTSGRARHALVYRTVAMMGGSVAPGAGGGPGEGAMAVMPDLPQLLAYHGYSAANWLALHAQRYLHRYGATREQLGWLAVTSRAHAAANPLAALRTPLSLEEHLTAPMISTPLGLFDCDLPVDGSIAVVVSAAEAAADAPRRPVRVEAMGRAGATPGWTGRPDYPAMAATEAAADLWARTDLRPTDVDVAELYDGFTFLTFAWLEALGLVGEGEAGPFVEGGERIARTGSLPLNTYGGQLSAGRMHGYWVLHEAVTQLRGDGAERQVPGHPEVAVVSAGGGPIAGCLLLTDDRDWRG